MEFQIPQFIFKESTVVTGLSFRQFLTLVGGGAIIVVVFILLKNHFLLFLIASFIVALITITFAFGQMGGQTFPVLFKNFVFYIFKPRVYVWRHKGMPEKIVREAVEKIQIVESRQEKPSIGLTKESNIQKLKSQIETK